MESKSSTKDGYLYGFDKLPRVSGKTSESTAKPLENTSTSVEAATDANNKTSTEQATPILNTTATKADTVSATAAINNPGQATTPTKTGAGMENTAPPKVDPPPTYRIEVKTDPATDGYIGNVYANGKLIYNSNGLPYMPGYFTYGEDGKKYTEKAGVTEFLRYKSKISGWTGNDGKDYPASTNITIS